MDPDEDIESFDVCGFVDQLERDGEDSAELSSEDE